MTIVANIVVFTALSVFLTLVLKGSFNLSAHSCLRSFCTSKTLIHSMLPPPTHPQMPDNKTFMRFYHWTFIGHDYPLAFGVFFSKGISGSNLPVDDF